MGSSWTRDWIRGVWDLPGPGIEPMSPALAGRFSTTEPPRKFPTTIFICVSMPNCICSFWKTWSAFSTCSLSFYFKSFHAQGLVWCLVGSDTWLPWFPTRIISVWHLKTNHTIVHASSTLSAGWGVCTNGPICKDEEESSLSLGFHFSANGTEARTCKTSRFVSKWKPNVLNPRGVLGPLSAICLSRCREVPLANCHYWSTPAFLYLKN